MRDRRLRWHNWWSHPNPSLAQPLQMGCNCSMSLALRVLSIILVLTPFIALFCGQLIHL